MKCPKIEGENIFQEEERPSAYCVISTQNSFDALIELFGENHLITALIQEIRKTRTDLLSSQAELAEVRKENAKLKLQVQSDKESNAAPLGVQVGGLGTRLFVNDQIGKGVVEYREELESLNVPKVSYLQLLDQAQEVQRQLESDLKIYKRKFIIKERESSERFIKIEHLESSLAASKEREKELQSKLDAAEQKLKVYEQTKSAQVHKKDEDYLTQLSGC